MARSNKKRLNDDDESFGKSNKQPVLSVESLLQAAQWCATELQSAYPRTSDYLDWKALEVFFNTLPIENFEKWQ